MEVPRRSTTLDLETVTDAQIRRSVRFGVSLASSTMTKHPEAVDAGCPRRPVSSMSCTAPLLVHIDDSDPCFVRSGGTKHLRSRGDDGLASQQS